MQVFCNGQDEYLNKKVKVPKGMAKIDRCNPPCGYYHYSNRASQGALIDQTKNFPDWYNPETHECHSAYSDRLSSWDYDHFERICKFIGVGDQGWSSRFPEMSEKKKKEFAILALKLGCESKDVECRMIHYHNVSTGYSCPVIVAVYRK